MLQLSTGEFRFCGSGRRRAQVLTRGVHDSKNKWSGGRQALNLKSEVEEGFLRSGTTKSAVPPVEMTNLRWWMMWENPSSAKLLSPATVD